MKNNKISSTYLTHNTKEAISMVRDGEGPIYIHNYNQPVAVLLSYKEWLKLSPIDPKKRRMTIAELEKIMFKTGEQTNMAKIIRKMRDEE